MAIKKKYFLALLILSLSTASLFATELCLDKVIKTGETLTALSNVEGKSVSYKIVFDRKRCRCIENDVQAAIEKTLYNSLNYSHHKRICLTGVQFKEKMIIDATGFYLK